MEGSALRLATIEGTVSVGMEQAIYPSLASHAAPFLVFPFSLLDDGSIILTRPSVVTGDRYMQ